jgi:hypothetical protein
MPGRGLLDRLVRDICNKDGKLISSDPCYNVSLSRSSSARLQHQLRPCRLPVSEFIIDLLQPVKIQKKNRERLLVSFGKFKMFLGENQKSPAIEESGHFICDGSSVQFLLKFCALRQFELSFSFTVFSSAVRSFTSSPDVSGISPIPSLPA